MRAVQRDVCTDYIGVHRTYTLEQTGGTAVCINCGQCANVCPVSSITEKYEYRDVREAVRDPEKIVIFNTSPSVRDCAGRKSLTWRTEASSRGKMVALLRKLGASYVLDTNFAADLTIMEEASELIERITKRTGRRRSLRVLSFLGQVCGDLSSGHRRICPLQKSPIGMRGRP